ncbi:UDP-N-acetylmuramoyl-L-alanine--D-glutamate ligase [Streptobacillus moniliformis]|uniref:UDP-N-acetylmuramoylalanine--D-glutamate ligase n=1 Tax=Streptobacillus moniliformis (strain ATCC 14647 / DSM 12112 / NCTC 10651 / 9901) TaxID=519441 RepID=D1AW49_STRM9|nr:UDP-N-acetylmuramoyl-L-alanine--D-glutamate ligase [Streptobacillus moniliformis]ACZ00525.1 UDP-N-acetylmuramoylalanine/D-glutamate ligase [Streptobacillus moniliformis DSM 12112]AVL43057.1 UDP-N-acetylmuramoyl-L-alanine--D-glutamate ligase [Streptobacillus moniliformis]QXW65296.1 UDP-N-acetylmuramoyl-L-alanine--D-glutamate ligase [Streptobacillus moniliformis]SQA12829.1 UDP-N-acetylmuramoylalanine--D-glutamate ligase [Streptobacillus moniliformis]
MIIVFGAGISGIGAKELLESKGKEVLLVDDKVGEITASKALEIIEDKEVEYIVKSPGISFENSFIKKAMEKNIPIYSEIDIAYEYMNKDIQIIAFTGTNGKTTTCTKTYEMLKKAGFNVELGGNVGRSFAEIVKENKELDYIVLELSSYQLENNPKIKPYISGIINLTPDHLGRYKDVEDYYMTKFNIFSNQDKKDRMIVNVDDATFLNLYNKAKELENYRNPKRVYISTNNKGSIFVKNGQIYVMKDLSEMYNSKFSLSQSADKLIDVKDIALKGEHNLENMLFLIATAKICGVPNKVIRNFLKEVKSIEHRMEDFFKKSNTVFINDSKGTNVASTKKAIASYENDVILICGGEDKKVPLYELGKEIGKKIKFTYIYGENRYLIENELKKVGYSKYSIFETVDECIMDIKDNVNFEEDITILYSPATSSFDQFKNFEERGKYFKNKVIEILGENNV